MKTRLFQLVLANGQMVWTALRSNEDGSTVQQGMKWKRVE